MRERVVGAASMDDGPVTASRSENPEKSRRPRRCAELGYGCELLDGIPGDGCVPAGEMEAIGGRRLAINRGS